MRNDYGEKEYFLGSTVDLVSVGGDNNFNDTNLPICDFLELCFIKVYKKVDFFCNLIFIMTEQYSMVCV